MSGIQSEYLLGLYFLVVSISYNGGKVSADGIRLVFAILFLALAFFGKSLIN